MSRDAAVMVEWADGTYRFRLAFAQLVDMQQQRDCGPWVLHERLRVGTWSVEDVVETLRYGLLGAGDLPAKQVAALIKTYVLDRPDWIVNAMVAQQVLGAALVGIPEAAPPKKETAAPTPETTGSTPPATTETASSAA